MIRADHKRRRQHGTYARYMCHILHAWLRGHPAPAGQILIADFEPLIYVGVDHLNLVTVEIRNSRTGNRTVALVMPRAAAAALCNALDDARVMRPKGTR